MAPSHSSSAERERDDRPRFNFGLPRLLSNRHTPASNTSKQNNYSSQHPPSQKDIVTPTDIPLPQEQLPLDDILRLLADSGAEPNFLISSTKAATAQLPISLPIPPMDVVTPALLRVCSASSPLEARCAGFDLLAEYLVIANTSLKPIDRSTLWFIVKDSGSEYAGSATEWSSKTKVILHLTTQGSYIDGMEGLVQCVSRWAFQAAAARSSPDHRESLSEDQPNNCLEWCLTFLQKVLRENAQALSPDDVSQIVDTFDRITRESLSTALAATDPDEAFATLCVNRALQYAQLTHILTETSIIPHDTLATILTTMMLLMSYTMQELPPIDVTTTTPCFRAIQKSSSPTRTSKAVQTAALESAIWHMISLLLSNPTYSVTTSRILKRLSLPHDVHAKLGPDIVLSIPGVSPAVVQARCALGAVRTTRLTLRRAAEGRLARNWVHTQSLSYAPTGLPTFGNYDMETVAGIYHRVTWKEGEGGAWEIERVSNVVPDVAAFWAKQCLKGDEDCQVKDFREQVVGECLGVVSDMLWEAALTDDNTAIKFSAETFGTVEGRLAGEVLRNAITCLDAQSTRSPSLIGFGSAQVQKSPVASTVSQIVTSLLLEDIATLSALRAGVSVQHLPPTLMPPLPQTLLSVSSHLQDEILAEVMLWHLSEGLLSPSNPHWLELLRTMFSATGVGLDRGNVVEVLPRNASREALGEVINSVYHTVREQRVHRLAFLATCLSIWEKTFEGNSKGEFIDASWGVIADGIVVGASDDESWEADERVPGEVDVLDLGDGEAANAIDPKDIELRLRSLICRVAREVNCGTFKPQRPSEASISRSSSALSPSASLTNSPQPQRSSSVQPAERLPPLMMSFFGLSSPSQTPSMSDLQAQNKSASDLHDSVRSAYPPAEHDHDHHEASCKSLSAVLVLIQAFQILAFSPPYSLRGASRDVRAPASHQCIHVFRDLLSLLTPDCASPLSEEDKTWHERPSEDTSSTGVGQAVCSRARLAVLQWLVRLRADRDHRLYIVKDLDAVVEPFARTMGRANFQPGSDDVTTTASAHTKPRTEQEIRLQRHVSARQGHGLADLPPRGRDQKPLRDVEEGGPSSRQREFSPSQDQSPRPLWALPEHLPFEITIGTHPSEGMTTYESGKHDADFFTASLWLPTSGYTCALIDLVKDESDWEILSYALCHLPVQLSNKHFFCGPLTSRVMVHFTTAILDCLTSNKLKERFGNSRSPEILAVMYHILTVLMSYKRFFSRPQLEAMIDAFHAGLGRYPVTIKPCLNALTLAAFELQSQITRSLSKIISQLSQIITNPAVSIHILELLVIVGNTPALYANFTEEDYKRVFTVALAYIQYHNRPRQSQRPGSHALSQHLLAIAYYTIYVWFLAVKLPDRPRYIPHITRNLGIANSHRSTNDVDEPTEVCLDWLARSTYSNVEAKPSRSFLNDVLTDAKQSSNEASQRSWIRGNAILTIRSLEPSGWIELQCRRPSGMTQFFSRLENISLTAFDTQPYVPQAEEAGAAAPNGSSSTSNAAIDAHVHPSGPDSKQEAIGSEGGISSAEDVVAPSVPAKLDDTIVDPSFLAVQISPYPNLPMPSIDSQPVPVTDETKRAFRMLDHTPVIDSHTIGILYVAPGQETEQEILSNRHGSPSYTRFIHGLGQSIKLKGQKKVYPGGLDTSNDDDGEHAFVWQNDIIQVVYHTTTLMPNRPGDPHFAHKKKHVGNDYVRIVWNDSGLPYQFDTLKTQFQFANVVIEPHSTGTIAAYSSSPHEHEYFKVSYQRAPGLPDFGPLGEFKLVSATSLSSYVREVSLLADFFAPVWRHTQMDTQKVEYVTNWRARLRTIKRLRNLLASAEPGGGSGHERVKDFTQLF